MEATLVKRHLKSILGIIYTDGPYDSKTFEQLTRVYELMLEASRVENVSKMIENGKK